MDFWSRIYISAYNGGNRKNMFLKCTVPFMTALFLCLIVVSAKAQTAADDRKALATDQQVLGTAYQQLQQDQKTNNGAGIEIDRDKINTAKQAFQTDEERIAADDVQEVTADQQALNKASQQMQADQAGNVNAVKADEESVKSASQTLQQAEEKNDRRRWTGSHDGTAGFRQC